MEDGYGKDRGGKGSRTLLLRGKGKDGGKDREAKGRDGGKDRNGKGSRKAERGERGARRTLVIPVDPKMLVWSYLDSTDKEFGPFPAFAMRKWFSEGLFPIMGELLIRLPEWDSHAPLRAVFPTGEPFSVRPRMPSYIKSSVEYPRADHFAWDGYPSQEGYEGYEGFDGYEGYEGYKEVLEAYAQMHTNALSNAQGEKYYLGIIKSFSESQGFGFIECAETLEKYGRDVFVHRLQMASDMEDGTQVTFTVVLNDKGMPQARDVASLYGQSSILAYGAQTDTWPDDEAEAAEANDSAEGEEKPPEAPVAGPTPTNIPLPAFGFGLPASPETTVSEDPIVEDMDDAGGEAREFDEHLLQKDEDEMLVGRIKSFNEKQGFGFIDCAEVQAQCGRDVFLHKAQKGSFPLHAKVKFRIKPNKQGHPQAFDLCDCDEIVHDVI